ncbi:MAG: hypothetical protein KatS3mg099_112 [Candidatus Parcubacteria bacterium]|nr:MAG: hypothetical protein KatS3mg099_112 [Candidatus Parcubacteria bacterium]
MQIHHQRVAEVLQELIAFKSGTTRVPIKSDSWEEIIWATFAFLEGEHKVHWDPQSHEQSVDIVVELEKRVIKISAKSGVIKRGAFLTISSYRLTTFSSLRDKLAFIRHQHMSFDYYLICAREDKREVVRYSLFQVAAERLAPSWLLQPAHWKKASSGYVLKDGFGFKAKIVFKMSNQLWYTIPLTYFSQDESVGDVEIPREAMGRGLLQYLHEKYPQQTGK